MNAELLETVAVKARNYSGPRGSRGLTLVEILITLLVISIGLLGVAGLHSLSMRNNYDALMRSHASALIADIADRMRANRSAVASYVVDIGETRAIDETSSQADSDIAEWKATLAAQLPDGDGSIEFDGPTSIVTIEIQWGERASAIQDEPVIMSFATQTEI